MNFRHCTELPFHTWSTQQEIVRFRHVLTYWKYTVWFWLGVVLEGRGYQHYMYLDVSAMPTKE